MYIIMILTATFSFLGGALINHWVYSAVGLEPSPQKERTEYNTKLYLMAKLRFLSSG